MRKANPCVLIVDDDPEFRDSVGRLLRSAGLDTQQFSSVADFFRADPLDCPVCLILDVRMPGRSGLDLQRDLAAAKRELPIIFVTAHADIPMSVQAMKGGAIEFLTRPLHDQDLLDAVETALARDRARRKRGTDLDALIQRFDALSSRERAVMALVATGHLNKQIANSRQYAIRLEERLNERSRIARELHDSLLQGVQGLIFRLQAIRNTVPDLPDEAAQMLDVALDKADAAVAEGRDTVSELRSAMAINMDLPHLLTHLRHEVRRHNEPGPNFELVVEGQPQAVGPLMRDEIFLVAREAVRNAIKHASARKIEVELSFGRKDLVLRVRDDGVGMDERVVAARGRQGHWGLSGMCERAESAGGRLTIWSRSAAGTEIELAVPAAVAYTRSGAQGA
jgi:FixJ family two-component response regulator